MNFSLDLLDSVAEESPADLLPIIKEAAKSGDHLAIRRWSESQADRRSLGLSSDLGASEKEFAKSILLMSSVSDGVDAQKRAGTNAKPHPCAESFSVWANSAYEKGDARDAFLSGLLVECVKSVLPRVVSAGGELLKLGVSPLTIANAAVCDLNGVKMGLQEKNATILAQSIAWQHPMTSEMVKKSKTSNEPWPKIAEVGVDGVFHGVNAAGYAMAIGDIKMLREVCKSTRGDVHLVSNGLSQAIDFALSSGLTKDCTPELAQSIAICISHGADLDYKKIGHRICAERITLAEEVSGHQHIGAIDYQIPALFMAPNTGVESLSAISKLASDFGLSLNGPVTQAGHGASILHYAAASGSADLVNGLIALGADPQAVDAKGLQPSHWAYVFDREEAHSLFENITPGQGVTFPSQLRPAAPVVPNDAAPEDWDPEGAASWAPDDEQWTSHDSENVFEDQDNLNSDSNDRPSVSSSPKGESSSKGVDELDTPLRDRVASSANEAQASKGSALLSWLQSAQASASSKPRVLEVAQDLNSGAPASGAKRVNFKSRL